MNITEFILIKDTWWRNIIATIYDIKRIEMKLDNQSISISWYGYVTFWDGPKTSIVHISNCSPEFIEAIGREIKNSS